MESPCSLELQLPVPSLSFSLFVKFNLSSDLWLIYHQKDQEILGVLDKGHRGADSRCQMLKLRYSHLSPPQRLDVQSADGSLAFLVVNNHSSLVYSCYSAFCLFNQCNCSFLGHVWFLLINCTLIYFISFNYFNWFTASKLFADVYGNIPFWNWTC